MPSELILNQTIEKQLICIYEMYECFDFLIFLKAIVTGDETWCFQYDPETKIQNDEWRPLEDIWGIMFIEYPLKVKFNTREYYYKSIYQSKY